MNEIQFEDNIDISSENITKIFSNQRKNLKQDILYLKDDILKDFKQIESKLNTKYEKINSTTLSKLDNFEKAIQTMKQKIFDLSSLISTDKNIQQKVSQLYEFKTKTEETFITQELSLKNNAKELKDAINNYDKIIYNSVIYPGIIGNNSKFNNFHQLIDYVLQNISQFTTFKDKSILDFKSYKNKLESLVSSFKIESESIMNNAKEYVNKKNEELEQKFKDILNNQESRIFDLRLENNKLGLSLENKIDKLNNERKKMLDIKNEIYNKFNEEVSLLKDLNKVVVKKFENYQNEFKLIKNRFTSLSEFIKDVRFRINMGELIKKRDIKSMSEKIDFTKKQKLENSNILAKSIIKKYINGEVGLNEVTHPRKRQKSIAVVENNFLYNLKNYKYNSQSVSFNKENKRMTLGPDNLMNFRRLQNSFTKNSVENSIYSEKSNNSISEEKDEDIDYMNIFKESNKENKEKEININLPNDLKDDKKKENINENNISYLYEDINENKNSEKKDNISNNKNLDDNFKKNNIIIKKDSKKNIVNNNNNIKQNIKLLLLNKNKLDDSVKINSKDNSIINIYTPEHKNMEKNDLNENEKTNSYEKRKLDNNNNIPKIKNNNKLVPSQSQQNINNLYKISSARKLSKIEQNKNFILNPKNNFNKTNILFGYNIFKNSFGGKLNVVEMNFDEANSLVKENEIIKKEIKENIINLISERNYKPFEKNKIFKKLKMNNSEVNLENKSMGKIVTKKNMEDNYYYNMMVKEDLKNHNNLCYLNYIQKNRIDLNYLVLQSIYLILNLEINIFIYKYILLI